MKFMYDFASLPKNQILLRDINQAANRLFDKLRILNIDALDISDYNKVYFGDKLSSLTQNLQKYSYILAWSLANSDRLFDRFVFVDYGGGSGMLSLLAKELNIGTVIYNDIYDISCRDASIIAESIGNRADYYINGDIDDLLIFLRTNSICCNAIASYDVIEHIYDIDGFLKKLNKINSSNGQLTVFMSSGANVFNPLIKNSLIKEQLKAEHKGQDKKFGNKERDCIEAYFEVRKEMIIRHDKNHILSEREIEFLAKTTRGMIESDIQRSIGECLKNGKFPQGQSHPTNTCDPFTGNWCEHLMDPYYLKDILSKTGFKVDVLGGYYGSPKNIVKRLLATSLNLVIYVFGKRGIVIAPFFSIYGENSF